MVEFAEKEMHPFVSVKKMCIAKVREKIIENFFFAPEFW
jgi:hypothetical protein